MKWHRSICVYRLLTTANRTESMLSSIEANVFLFRLLDPMPVGWAALHLICVWTYTFFSISHYFPLARESTGYITSKRCIESAMVNALFSFCLMFYVLFCCLFRCSFYDLISFLDLFVVTGSLAYNFITDDSLNCQCFLF